MRLILLAFCIGTVQQLKVVIGGLVSPLLLLPLGILVVIDCSYGNCICV